MFITNFFFISKDYTNLSIWLDEYYYKPKSTGYIMSKDLSSCSRLPLYLEVLGTMKSQKGRTLLGRNVFNKSVMLSILILLPALVSNNSLYALKQRRHISTPSFICYAAQYMQSQLPTSTIKSYLVRFDPLKRLRNRTKYDVQQSSLLPFLPHYFLIIELFFRQSRIFPKSESNNDTIGPDVKTKTKPRHNKYCA